MLKSQCLLASVAAIAVITASRLLAQHPDRDLWVGVLTYDGTIGGDVPPDAGVAMRPIAALVGGKWHDDPQSRGELRETGRGGAVWWEPVNRVLPRSWLAWLADGRRVSFGYTGPARDGPFMPAALSTDIPLSAPSRNATAEDVLGLAISGRVDVHLFADVDGASRDVVPDVMRRAMVDAEAKEIKTETAGHTDHWYRMAAEVPFAHLSNAAYDVDIHRVVTLGDGTRITVLEGFKSLAKTEGCNGLRSGAAIEERRGGRSRLLGAWADLICDELSVSSIPIAVIERAGNRCWVTMDMYEDGVQYAFHTPPQVGKVMNSACAIR